MIDPKALQQHFRKIHEKEVTVKPDIPRIADTVPLTSVQVISVPVEEVIQKIDELLEPVVPDSIETFFNIEEPNLSKTPLPILSHESTNNDDVVAIKEDNDEYDPYGYYSSANK